MSLSSLSQGLLLLFVWGKTMVFALEEDQKPAISNSTYLFAIICLILYSVVLLLSNTGVLEILRKFNGSTTVLPPVDFENLEGVTILRPLKGIDPELSICLESSLLQYYPAKKLEVIFCVETSNDPSIPIVEDLISKYPNVDAKLLIDDKENPDHYGPNPKINNLAKGFMAAKNDIIWVMDSNVWAPSGLLIRSVYALNNNLDNMNKVPSRLIENLSKKVKIIHHLPLAVALKSSKFATSSSNSLFKNLGCKLDEVFLKTSHAKFYVGFNKVAIAPCVNGKSNIYRISDIDLAVQKIGEGHLPSVDGKSGDLFKDAAFYGSKKGFGIRYFSKFIGEDNMIGIAIWNIGGRTGMTGDSVLQPLGNHINNGIKDYILRRSRWLRVRKYMVLAATLLEPTTESIVSSFYGTFAVSVIFFNTLFSKWWFIFHYLIWMTIDYYQYHLLLNHSSLENPTIEHSSPISKPYFAEPNYNGFADDYDPPQNLKSNNYKRPFKQWFLFWVLREVLALPIWIYAMIGTTIDWRGRPFIIKSDLTAEEI